MPLALKRIDRDRRLVQQARAALKRAVRTFLSKLAEDAAAAARETVDRVARDQKGQKHSVEEVAERAEWAKLTEEVKPQLERVARDGARKAVLQVVSGGAGGKPPSDELDDLLDVANERAIDWASDHAGELVKQIEEHTRDGVRLLTQQALEEGWSNDELAAALEESGVFSEARAETIARTETAFADVEGNRLGWAESGVVVGKQWIVGQDDVCDLCLALDGEVVALDATFDGGVKGPPLHPNCVLPGTLVSAAGVSAHFKRWFAGEVVRIFVETGHDLAVTPNHPVLTLRGWLPARELCQSDYLIEASEPAAAVFLMDPEDHHVQTRVEEIAHALLVAGGVTTCRVPVSAEDFHGDGVVGEDVDVVLADRRLQRHRESSPAQQGGGSALRRPDVREQLGLCGRDLLAMSEGLPLATHGGVRSRGDALALGGRSPGHAHAHRAAAAANAEADAHPGLAERRAVAAAGPGEIDARLAGLIAPVKITKLVFGEPWMGHVFNLQTASGWYLANGLIVHNCRCDLLPVLADED